jgi:DNA-binding NtrC family response regulator
VNVSLVLFLLLFLPKVFSLMPGDTSSKPCLLVVDDDEQVLELLSDVLAENHEVVTFSHPVRALDWCRQVGSSFRVSTLITDLKMPGLNGLDLIRQIRVCLPGLPAIIASGSWTALKVADSHSLPGVIVLPKPFDIPSLLSALRKVSGRHG